MVYLEYNMQAKPVTYGYSRSGLLNLIGIKCPSEI